jgi:hypothetical protein
MKLTEDILKKILMAISTTQPDEIGCTDCFEIIDEFAELKLQGKNAEEAMPLVQDHLNRCGNCREEFEALLDCLKATSSQP